MPAMGKFLPESELSTASHHSVADKMANLDAGKGCPGSHCPSSSCVALPVTVSPHPAPCFFLGVCMLGSCCQTRACFQGITTFAMLLCDISGVLSLLGWGFWGVFVLFSFFFFCF